ncbi:MAG TPA: DNA mismatch repair endonuclease MutL [Chloroflexota bacterium]|nr:DNA mismatch repair endonuclease MutL [Chloroflexota bacterium]
MAVTVSAGVRVAEGPERAYPSGGPAIRLLPDDLVTKIAAGEVVERPASVVKELVENALDAGATSVRVEVQRGGFTLIRVTDNGCGIPAEELPLAVQRHATSKLAGLDDLFRVRTLGFRGEALASIAAVSAMEITSRVAGGKGGAAGVGHTIRLQGGRVLHHGATGCPVGTTVAVRQLFHNVPARQAFQRTAAGEVRQIVQLCTHLALTAPRVRFTLEVDGRQAVQTPGSGDLREALAAAYGPTLASRALALPEREEDGMRVWGFCCGPEEHRNTRLYLTFSVNGRVVRSAVLTYAVEEAYHALLPGGRHPVAVVCLETPLDDVDVNVHPTKLEIRLRRERLAFKLVREAVREALREFAPVPVLAPTAGWYSEGDSVPPPGPFAPDPAPGGLPAPPSSSGLRPEPDRGAAPDPVRAPPQTPADIASLVEAAAPPPPAQPPPTKRLRALGQVGLTYVVAEDASGVYLIDQHSAHERVLYEQLLKQERERSDDAPVAQLLLAPESIELNAVQHAWLAENAATLAAFGFQLEPFGAQAWLLRAVPRAIAAKGRSKVLAELIDALIEREYGDGPLHDQARWAVACHSAVRAGDALMPEEMAALIAQLEACDMRRTCPHGRPTMIHLSHAQLEREFGRR